MATTVPMGASGEGSGVRYTGGGGSSQRTRGSGRSGGGGGGGSRPPPPEPTYYVYLKDVGNKLVPRYSYTVGGKVPKGAMVISKEEYKASAIRPSTAYRAGWTQVKKGVYEKAEGRKTVGGKTYDYTRKIYGTEAAMAGGVFTAPFKRFLQKEVKEKSVYGITYGITPSATTGAGRIVEKYPKMVYPARAGMLPLGSYFGGTRDKPTVYVSRFTQKIFEGTKPRTISEMFSYTKPDVPPITAGEVTLVKQKGLDFGAVAGGFSPLWMRTAKTDTGTYISPVSLQESKVFGVQAGGAALLPKLKWYEKAGFMYEQKVRPITMKYWTPVATRLDTANIAVAGALRTKSWGGNIERTMRGMAAVYRVKAAKGSVIGKVSAPTIESALAYTDWMKQRPVSAAATWGAGYALFKGIKGVGTGIKFVGSRVPRTAAVSRGVLKGGKAVGYGIGGLYVGSVGLGYAMTPSGQRAKYVGEEAAKLTLFGAGAKLAGRPSGIKYDIKSKTYFPMITRKVKTTSVPVSTQFKGTGKTVKTIFDSGVKSYPQQYKLTLSTPKPKVKPVTVYWGTMKSGGVLGRVRGVSIGKESWGSMTSPFYTQTFRRAGGKMKFRTFTPEVMTKRMMVGGRYAPEDLYMRSVIKGGKLKRKGDFPAVPERFKLWKSEEVIIPKRFLPVETYMKRPDLGEMGLWSKRKGVFDVLAPVTKTKMEFGEVRGSIGYARGLDSKLTVRYGEAIGQQDIAGIEMVGVKIGKKPMRWGVRGSKIVPTFQPKLKPSKVSFGKQMVMEKGEWAMQPMMTYTKRPLLVSERRISRAMRVDYAYDTRFKTTKRVGRGLVYGLNVGKIAGERFGSVTRQMMRSKRGSYLEGLYSDPISIPKGRTEIGTRGIRSMRMPTRYDLVAPSGKEMSGMLPKSQYKIIPVSGFGFKPTLKGQMKTGFDVDTRFKSGLDEALKGRERMENIMETGIKMGTMPRVDMRFDMKTDTKSISKTTMKSIITTPTVTKQPAGFDITTPPPPPPPPPPAFGGWWLPKRKRRRGIGIVPKKGEFSFSPKYFASLEATGFGIYGKKPTKRALATGVVVRPMVRV